jgi:hypothetical protein
MPITPIDPKTLVKHATKWLQEHEVFISDNTPLQIEEICKLFNYCIFINNKEKTMPIKFIYAAQTGSGKSISLQVYVSLLKKESSLIVVSKVSEAISYCRFINKLSNDDNYARCYYAVTDENVDSDVRVNNYQLKKYRCIVITHSMFKLVNQRVEIDIYKLYQGKQRDLIVIDEKISLYEVHKISLSEINKIIDEFMKINIYSEISKDYNLDNNIFYRLDDFFDMISRPILSDTKKSVNLIEHNLVAKCFTDIEESVENTKLIINERVEQLFKEIQDISGITDDNFKKSVITSFEKSLENIKYILSDDLLFYKHKKSLLRVDNIESKLGACVNLDATSSINEFYKVANRYASFFAEVPAKQIRKYSNLSIYKAKGYSQGRQSIFEKLDKDTVKQNVEMYLSYAYGVLEKPTDKLLIVTQKGFVSKLKDKCIDKRISFTYWGNHTGKNDWNDCNKVMIVGWNYIPNITNVTNALSALDDTRRAESLLTTEVVNEFEITQLADDLVQAVMRANARKIATKDGDCNKNEIYLFYQDYVKYNAILTLFQSQFPQAKIIDWKPKGIQKRSKKTADERTADDFIRHLRAKEDNYKTYLFSDLKKDLNVKPPKATRVTSSEYFKKELEKEGYVFKKINGKSKYFILK